MKMSFPNPDDILNFTLTIEPDEGMYKGGAFHFSFSVNQNFPHDPPKVKCTQKIYHPNIDLEGNVCLNILREDWKPVLNLNAVIVGMQVRSLFPCLSHTHTVSLLCYLNCLYMGGMLIRLVSLPGAECFGSPEQRSGGGFASESGGVQEECADIYGRWLSEGN
ncbi:ubiquitin-conjugating enzyme/RWD-like protein [Aspergillus avenaceus]|uniref:Ubiquitin-conjugating enzyme E2 2 n=1 Tax=Aspergillus avenaceus TaxID=36643 RepID=A0A5N6U3G2_ASPAV|nr:ubiquitin-conjugating enzyme/RWD-like protein [Aspergillus avenaceus]